MSLQSYETASIQGCSAMAEVQDIFSISFPEYCRTRFVPVESRKVAQAIMNCRTSALGGHIDRCPECGYERNAYNSCRNRHCPKCQTLKKEQWIGRRCEDILDVPHFHVVFTVPCELHTLFLQNPATLYGLLFRASANTIKELAVDTNHLGALPGFTSVLHTWGQNLSYHPHIHMVVTGGGITKEHAWKYSRKKFFLPVRIISKLFRGKFLAELRTLYKDGRIRYHGTDGTRASSEDFSTLIAACYAKDWCVYCKQPFSGTGGVFSYLGRYTHRVAISNHRIQDVTDTHTTFSWRDYADKNITKNMTIENTEFIRRFLLHVLPHGFTRIRHYGLYAPRNKATKLAACRKALGSRTLPKQPKESTQELLFRILGRDVSVCPCCNTPLRQYALARASPAC